jgi:hypothetical protein
MRLPSYKTVQECSLWVFGTLFAIIVIAPLSEFVIKWLEEQGLYAHPSQTVDHVISVLQILKQSEVLHWALGIILGLTAGIWLGGLLRRNEQKTVPANSLSLTNGEERTIKSLVSVLSKYMQGFEKLLTEVQGIASQSELKRIKIQYHNLKKPALQYIGGPEGRLLGAARGYRFIGTHPLGTLERPADWSIEKFDLWTKIEATILHLKDFREVLNIRANLYIVPHDQAQRDGEQ